MDSKNIKNQQQILQPPQQIEKPKENPVSAIVEYLLNIIHAKQRNCVIGIFGRPGTGKSYTTATLLKAIDPTFHVDRVFYSVEDIARFVNTNPKRGSAFMLDEAGVATNYRRWFSTQNSKMMDMIQTWRHRGLICAMVAPSIKLIDKVNHDFFDIFIETIKVYHTKGFVKVKVKIPESSSSSDKSYSKFLKIPTKVGEFRKAKITSVYVGHPGKNFTKPYEKIKMVFTTKLNEKSYFELQGSDERVGENSDIKRMTPMQEKIFELLWQGKTRKIISREIGVSVQTICGHVMGIKAKGHEMPPKGWKPKTKEQIDNQLKPRMGENNEILPPPHLMNKGVSYT